MKKLSDQELQLLQRVSAAGGSHCFSREDNIPAAGHKALRSLVTLTAQGRAEVE